MNNSLIKFLGIFLIFLFCFSPLGAIDLDQGDNSTQINDFNNTDVEDLNDTDIADDSSYDENDMEIKSDNETDDIVQIDDINKTDIKDLNDTDIDVDDANRSAPLGVTYGDFEVSVNDIHYGEEPVLIVDIKRPFKDAHLNIHPPSKTTGGKSCVVKVPPNVKAHLEIPLSCVLPPDNDIPLGEHTIGAYLNDSHDGHLDYWEEIDYFNVYKGYPNLTVDADDITQGDNLSVEIHASKLYNGDVTFKLGRDFHTVHLVKGVGCATIDCHKLSPGNYPISAYVDETDKFYKDLTLSTFTVLENPNLKVKVNNISFYDKLKVDVSANNTINGIVQVKLNNSDGVYDVLDDVYDVNVKDGAGSVEITTYLPPGNYTASAYYAGNDVFGESKAITKFAVNYHVPDMSINVNNINVGEKAKVEISASSNLTDFTDNVQVQLNNSDKVYDVLVRNGYGKVDIGGLAPGNYTANAYFKGDGVFEPKNVSTTFSVLQLDPDLKISVSNLIFGDKAKVEVSANKNFTGNVRVQLNNSDDVYDVDVKDGVGSVEISGLLPGNYNAHAYFKGNENFISSNASTSFSVNGRTLLDPDLKIHVSKLIFGDKAKVEVSANKNLTGNVRVQLNNSDDVYDVDVKDGAGSVVISGLAPGNYTASAYYDGGVFFKEDEATTKFTVNYVS